MSFLVKLRKLDQLIQDEITCPVCMEEFLDPKCLPCFHSVCKKCLEGMTYGDTTEVIQCPVDRRRSFLPDQGIEGLPSSIFLLRMLEARPGRHERTHTKTALEKCREKVQRIRQAVENKVNTAFEKEKLRVKQQIHSSAEQLRRIITEKENEVCSQVDRLIAKEMEACTESIADEVLDQTESLFEEVENMIKKLQTREIKEDTNRKSFVDYLLELDESNVILSVMRKPCSSFIPFVFEFSHNRTFLECLKDQKLGHITSHTGRLNALNENALSQTHLPCDKSLHTNVIAGQVIKTLEVPEEFKCSFKPSAIAVSRLGQVAITDAASDRVLIYDEDQEYMSSFNGKSGNDTKPIRDVQPPIAVTFSHDHNIIVFKNSCKYDEHGQLRVFDSNGQYLKSPIQESCLDNAHLTCISVDTSGRVIAAFNHPVSNRPFIQVYSSKGAPEFTITEPLEICGDDREKERECNNLRVEKVFYSRGKFVVSYSDFMRNRCGVHILDRNGNRVSSLEEAKLMENEKLYPMKIAADQLMGTLLCYHGLKGVVHVYDFHGRHVSQFSTVAGVKDIALTVDGQIVAICDQSHPARVCVVAYR